MKSFLKTLALNKDLYLKAKEEGLLPQWFDTEVERWFVRCLDFIHGDSGAKPENLKSLFAQFADVYINDLDLRTKFLLFVEEVLSDSSCTDFNLAFKLLKEKFLSRLMVRALKKVVKHLSDSDFEKAKTVFQKAAFYFTSSSSEGFRVCDIKDAKSHEKAINPPPTPSVLTGYPSIDNATSGFNPGELIVIMSGFAEGKSTLLLNIAKNVFINGGNVVYFSFEMPYLQIVRRFDALLTGIAYSKLKSGVQSSSEKEALSALLNRLRNFSNNFYIVDCPGADVLFMDSKLSSLPFLPSLIVVDYLALVRSTISYRSTWETLNDVAIKIRGLARKYNVPVLTAAQVRREAISTDREFYEPYDIAMAFSIMQHSDIVISMRIDDPDSLMAGPICLLKCKFLKNRDGERVSFLLHANFENFQIEECVTKI